MNNEIVVHESFLIFLDSKNGDIQNKYKNSSVKFQFEGSLFFNRDDYIQILFSVNNFIAPNSLYIINEYNNKLSITYNEITQVVNVPYGNYNIISIQKYLTSVLPNHFTISFSTITNKITFTNSIYDFIINPSNIYDVLGLEENKYYASLDKTFTFPFSVNFIGTQNINISIENINTNNLDSYTKTQSSIIQSIPIDVNTSVIKYINGNDHKIPLKINYLDYIQINIIDDNNQLVNFNNKHWNLTLEFTIMKLINPYSQVFQNILTEN